MSGLSRVYGWPDLPPATKAVAQLDPAVYAGYRGRYRSTEALDWGAVVVNEGDRLFWEDLPDGLCDELFPESATAFFTLERPQGMTFVGEPDGSVETVLVGEYERLERVG